MALKNLPKNLTDSSPPPSDTSASTLSRFFTLRSGQVVEVNGKGGIPCSRHAEGVAFFHAPAPLRQLHLGTLSKSKSRLFEAHCQARRHGQDADRPPQGMPCNDLSRSGGSAPRLPGSEGATRPAALEHVFVSALWMQLCKLSHSLPGYEFLPLISEAHTLGVRQQESQCAPRRHIPAQNTRRAEARGSPRGSWRNPALPPVFQVLRFFAMRRSSRSRSRSPQIETRGHHAWIMER